MGVFRQLLKGLEAQLTKNSDKEQCYLSEFLRLSCKGPVVWVHILIEMSWKIITKIAALFLLELESSETEAERPEHQGASNDLVTTL